jgi:hypothetical protein
MTWLDALGWAGSAVLVWSLLQTRILRLRVWNLVGCAVLIGFNAAIRVWPMVGLNVTLAAINLWTLRQLIGTRHSERRYEVVPVGNEDPMLARTLRAHAADIARFNPGFTVQTGDTAEAGDATRSAFLIVTGDETIGVVVIRPGRDDPSVAQVELDYVTPRFRDFTPGEFVYRRSPLFTERGFRTVVSPPGMVAPYYQRLGFRPAGDSFVLDLADG